MYHVPSEITTRRRNTVFRELVGTKCECYQWRRTRFPCKHMFALIGSEQDCSWDILPVSYVYNPYITIDDVICSGTDHNQRYQRNHSTSEQIVATQIQPSAIPTTSGAYVPTTDSTSQVARTQIKWRDTTKEIENASYECHDKHNHHELHTLWILFLRT